MKGSDSRNPSESRYSRTIGSRQRNLARVFLSGFGVSIGSKEIHDGTDLFLVVLRRESTVAKSEDEDAGIAIDPVVNKDRAISDRAQLLVCCQHRFLVIDKGRRDDDGNRQHHDQLSFSATMSAVAARHRRRNERMSGALAGALSRKEGSGLAGGRTTRRVGKEGITLDAVVIVVVAVAIINRVCLPMVISACARSKC